MSDLLHKLRESNNLFNTDKSRGHNPDAFQVVKSWRAFDDGPRCPRSPERQVFNIDPDVSSDVATIADWFDLPKSQAAELMLRIAAGELYKAWQEFDETGGVDEHRKTDIDGYTVMSAEDFQLEPSE